MSASLDRQAMINVTSWILEYFLYQRRSGQYVMDAFREKKIKVNQIDNLNRQYVRRQPFHAANVLFPFFPQIFVIYWWISSPFPQGRKGFSIMHSTCWKCPTQAANVMESLLLNGICVNLIGIYCFWSYGQLRNEILLISSIDYVTKLNGQTQSALSGDHWDSRERKKSV